MLLFLQICSVRGLQQTILCNHFWTKHQDNRMNRQKQCCSLLAFGYADTKSKLFCSSWNLVVPCSLNRDVIWSYSVPIWDSAKIYTYHIHKLLSLYWTKYRFCGKLRVDWWKKWKMWLKETVITFLSDNTPQRTLNVYRIIPIKRLGHLCKSF